MDIEKLAEIQHAIWSHWMRYFFTCCREMPHSGNLIVPFEKVERWTKQANTPYDQLSEEEKESDRDIIRKFLSDAL